MRWTVAALAVVAATVAATTAVLLAYGGQRNDPVGRLSPIANLRAPQPAAPAPTVSTRGGEGRHSDD